MGLVRWRFDDTLQYDWQSGVARYQGNLQRPGETEATYQELEHSLRDPEDYGQYVDKLSQFFVIGCHFGVQNDESPLLLNYLDDTLGRYRMNLIRGEKPIKVTGSFYDTIRLESEPYEHAREHSPTRELLVSPRWVTSPVSKPNSVACH